MRVSVLAFSTIIINALVIFLFFLYQDDLAWHKFQEKHECVYGKYKGAYYCKNGWVVYKR